MRGKRQRTAFGERLFQARTAAGLTQPQLAKAVGMAQSTLGELEYIGNGSSYTSQIAKACGVRPDWLAEGHGPMVEKIATISPAVATVAAEIDSLPKKQRDWVLTMVQQALEIAHETIGLKADHSVDENGNGTIEFRPATKRAGSQ